MVSEQRSHDVTIRSVLISIDYLNYLVVPASHSNKPGLEALMGAFSSFLSFFIIFHLVNHKVPLNMYKAVETCTGLRKVIHVILCPS